MAIGRLSHTIRRGLQVYVDLYLKRRTPTIIYTPGRVGSMALYHALDACGVFVLQAHVLNPDSPRVDNQPGTAAFAYRHIIRPRRPANIITLVRDPVALMISDFFPKLRWLSAVEKPHEQLSLEELCDLFNTRYFDEGRHLEKLEWFDREFEALLGIDVYAYPQPGEKGVVQFQQDPYAVLILKTELDDSEKERAVSNFLSLKTFKMMRTNVGEQKSYGKVYKRFKQQIVVNPAHLDTIYASQYAQHFFTQAERDTLRIRWGSASVTIP